MQVVVEEMFNRSGRRSVERKYILWIQKTSKIKNIQPKGKKEESLEAQTVVIIGITSVQSFHIIMILEVTLVHLI